MNRILHLIITVILVGTSAFQAAAQDKFIILGKMKVETGRLTRGKIEVEKNGAKDKVLIVDGSGKFEIKLDYNSSYIISFSQEEYVTKKLSFSTRAPKDRIEEGFDPFSFQVTLFKQYDEINTVIFNQPVGQIEFSPEVDDFDYDTDYTQSILRQLQEVEAQVKKKQKEEEKEAKKSAKLDRKREDPPNDPPIVEEKTEPPAKETPSKPVTERKETPRPSRTPTTSSFSRPSTKSFQNVVVLHAYTVGQYSYPNLPAYGYINFGDGAGNREINKEQYDQYVKEYR